MARKLAILGAGGTGLTLAASWALAGHDVSLIETPEQTDALLALKDAGHISLDGPEGVLSAPLPALAANEDDVMRIAGEAELLVICCVAWRQEDMLRSILPALRSGQTVLFSPGNAGAPRFCRMLQERHRQNALPPPDVLVGEVEGNWFPCRRTGPSSVVQALPLAPHYTAALPASRTPELVRRLQGLLEAKPGTCVLETTLNSPNVVIHLTASLLNIGGIEKAGTDFALFRDGLTPAVYTLLELLDAEKNTVFAAYGLTARSPLPLLRTILRGDLTPGLRRFTALGGPDGPSHRYLREDAMCGVSLLYALGQLASVPVPLTGACLRLAGALHGCDYISEGGAGLAPSAWGFTGHTPEELLSFLA